MHKCVFFILALIFIARWVSYREDFKKALVHCASFESLNSKGKYQRFKGTLTEVYFGTARLENVSIMAHEGEVPLMATINLPHITSMDLGLRVIVSGQARCTPILQNPGKLDDRILNWRLPTVKIAASSMKVYAIDRNVSLVQRLRLYVLKEIKEMFRDFPGLLGLEWAVWTADASLLPDRLVKFYMEGGLMAVLALSGQHVACLVLLLEFLLFPIYWLLSQSFYARPWIRRLKQFLPMICAAVLIITSHNTPSITRSLFMLVASLILCSRGLFASPLQVAGSSFAILLLLNPSYVTSISFLLSSSLTALSLLFFMEHRTRRRLAIYLFSAMATPLLAVPMISFFFGHVSLTAPLYSVLLSGIWDLLILPLAFFLPLIRVILGQGLSELLFLQLEKLWSQFILLHEYLWVKFGTNYVSTVRLTSIELIIAELVIISLLWLFIKFLPFARSALYD